MSVPATKDKNINNNNDDGGYGGLKIIGAGCGRTGTSSLQEALQILGLGPCYHMREVFKDPHGISKWEKVAQSVKEADNAKGHYEIPDEVWNDIFQPGGYQSTTDFPAALYYKELLMKYPNAKVILSIRDEDKWADSVNQTIIPASRYWRFLYRLAGTENTRFSNLVHDVLWKPFVGGRDDARNRNLLIEAYRNHNEEVREHVPPEQLLVFEVKEGWEKLCKFLDVPVPETPFPRLNDTPHFQKMVIAKRQKTLKRLLIGGVALGISVWIGIKSYNGRGGSSRLGK